MTVEDYERQAAATAVYREGSIYPYLGLIEEIGELSGVLAKADRDNDGKLDAPHREQLQKELGDVLWMLAAVARDESVPLHEEPLFSTEPSRDTPAYFIIAECSRAASSLMAGVEMPFYSPDNDLAALFSAWEDLCFAFGWKPVDVAAANIAKLEDRKARGKLQGSGDDR